MWSFVNLGYATLFPDVDVAFVTEEHLKSTAPAVCHYGHQITHGSFGD